jgi:putative ABC transport system ATP-binding protein
MTLITLQQLSKLYGFGDATTVALDEVDLTVQKGEFIAVMGPSGSGKSTLMNMIGLLDRPTHGEFLLNGRSVSRIRSTRRARLRRDTIGFVFQSFNLIPKLNVLENVALPLAYKGMTQTRRLKNASVMLERVGLSDREYFMPKQLSGGQAQRVAVARALVNNPSIIIADEPTGNLDSASSRLVMELLADIHKTGNTILLVTHNPELTRYADRVVFMHDGAIIADELTRVGEVPELAKRLYFMPRKTDEDDLAGVSAIMSAVPSKGTPKQVIPRKKRRKKAKSYKGNKNAITVKGKK